jgi:3-hydroxyisobutyrate dehydrogenase
VTMADGSDAVLAPSTIVAFIGLGRMGMPMAGRLLAVGYDVHGYDVGAAARRAYSDAFGRVAADAVADGSSNARAVILMLPDSKAVCDVLTADGFLASFQPGAIVIDMSSSDPVQTRQLAPEVARQGLAFVDAPVSGGVTGAETGELTIMVGGDPDTVARCSPLLDELGRSVVHVGPVGAGHALKALNNLLSATHLLASAEVVRVGSSFGLDPRTMLEAINGSSGRSYSTEYKLPQFVLSGTFASGFALQLMNKDVQTAVSLARATRTATPLTDVTGALWSRAATELEGDADHTEIARWLERIPSTGLIRTDREAD